MLEAGAMDDVAILEVGGMLDDEELADDVGVFPDVERVALGDIKMDDDAGLVLGDNGVALDVVREVEEVKLDADCVKEGLDDNGVVLEVVREVEDIKLEADSVKVGPSDDKVALDVAREVEEVKLEADCVEAGLGDDELALDAVGEAEEVKLEVDCAKAGLAIKRARKAMIPSFMLAMAEVNDVKRYKRSRILHKM